MFGVFRDMLKELQAIRSLMEGDGMHQIRNIRNLGEQMAAELLELMKMCKEIDDNTAAILRTLQGQPPTPPSQPPTLPLLWDPKLTQLGFRQERDILRRDGEYFIYAVWCTINGNWDNVPDWAKPWQHDTLGGDHHAYGRCEDESGRPLSNTFVLAWGTNQGSTTTPEPSGWANFPLYGGPWYPDTGSRPPYDFFCFGGDKIYVGLPANQHVSFFVVWRKRSTKAAFDVVIKDLTTKLDIIKASM